MLAWMPMPDDRPNAESRPTSLLAGVLYRLTVVFPSCAGAILALYTISLHGCSFLKIRPR